MLAFINTFSYIPVVLCFVAILALAVVIFKNKTDSDFFVLKLFFLIVLITGLICSLILKNSSILAVFLFIALILLIPVQNSKKKPEADDVLKTKTEPELSASDQEEKTDSDPLAEIVNAELLETSRDFLISLSSCFTEKEGLLQLLDKVNESVIKETAADGGVILLIDEFEDLISVKNLKGTFPPPYKLDPNLPHKIARVETNFRFAQFPLNETIFGITASSGKAELITDPASDPRIFQNEPEDFLKCGSYIFVPMLVKDVVIGVLSLARKPENPVFSEQDFTKAKFLTDFASAAVQNIFSYQEIIEHRELIQESTIACKLQKTMQPKNTHSIPGANFGFFFNGVEGVCGDYFDIIPCRKDRISFVLGDIAGKGMNSLLVMVMLRAILQLIVNTTKNAGTILTWANRGITGKINIDHFASMTLVNYNPPEKKLEIASAGNSPVLLYHSDTKQIEDVTVFADPIGVDKLTEYTYKEFVVNSGDIVILYTDGLLESVNSESKQYGVENIRKLITENASLKAQDIATKIKKNHKEFCGSVNQHDDQTLILIKIE
ncbi:MAG: SpoIIE family protein phosphatase [Spirochaetaceae bacterium]|nr:SpoIIE family protein phosphatase [Spirochaetaceae bacterium]